MAGNSFADALVKAVSKLAPKQYKTESGAIDTGRIIRDNTISVGPATQSTRPATQSIISTPVLNSVTGNTTQSGGRPASSSNRGATVSASATGGPARATDGPATIQTPELDSAVGKPTEQKSVSELLYSPFLSGLFGSSAMPEGLSERDQKAFQRGANAQDVFYNWPAIVSNFLTPGAASPTDTGLAAKATRAGELTQLAAAGGITKGSAGIAKAIQMGEDLVTKDNRHDAFTEEILRERNEAQKKIEEETKDWTPKQKEYYGYAQEVFRMAPTMLMGWAGALGAAGTAAAEGATLAQSSGALSTASRFISGLLTNPTFHHTALEVTGSSYEDAIEKGADEKTAALYATLNGVLNAALEVGGAQELPKEIVGSPFKNALLEYLKSIPEEGMEEVNQGVVERALQALLLDKNNEVQGIQNLQAIFDLATAVNEFKGGAAVSALVGGGNLALNGAMGGYRQSPTEQQQQNAQPTTPLAQTILSNEQQQADNTQLNAPQAPQGNVSQSGQAGTPGAPTNAQNAAQARVTEILSGTVSNSKAEAIINDPELRAAFEEMSGQELTGTKSEQRQIIKGFAAQKAEAANRSEVQETAEPETAPAQAPVQEESPTAPQPAQAPAQQQAPAVQQQPQANGLSIEERNAIVDQMESLTRLADRLRIDGDTQREAEVRAQIAELQRQLNGEQAAGTPPTTTTPTNPSASTTSVTPENPAGAPPTGQTAAAEPTRTTRTRTTVSRVAPAPADAEGTKLSAGVETVRSSPITTEGMQALIDQSVEDGGYRYIPITNDETAKKATDSIRRRGWDASIRAWTADARAGRTSAKMQAIGQILINNAISSGDQNLATDLLTDYIAAGTNLGQALQARKLLANMDPEVRLYKIDRSVEEMLDRMGDAAPEGVAVSEELKEKYRNAPDEQTRDKVVEEIQQSIANQIPIRIFENGKINWKNAYKYWTALRYINMLGNIKTQVRNLGGNLASAVAFDVKNSLQSAIEGLVYAASGGKYERQTSFHVKDYSLVKAALDYYKKNSGVIDGDGRRSEQFNKDSFQRGIEEKQHFAFKPFDVANTVTNWMTEGGDKLFIGPQFARRLAGYLQANGIDAATFSGIQDGSIEATAEQKALLERAINYASKEAQEATFHDHNAYSDAAAKALRGKDTPPLLRMIGEGIMPFRRTPANIMVRIGEFSPIGLVDTLISTGKTIAGVEGSSWQNVINKLSKATTGTGLMLIGAMLRNAGRLRGKDEDDKQNDFDKLQGQQNWSYVLPDGRSFTLDWLSPNASTLFMGAQLADAFADGGISGREAVKLLTSVTSPMVEMSMLQGIKDTFDNIKFAENDLGEFLAATAASYLTQGLTSTLGGQIEKAFQGDRRTETYVDTESWLPRSVQRRLGALGEKIPYLDYQQVEYLDAWGRPQMYDTNGFSRAVNDIVNPSYVSNNNSTEVDAEIQRLYDANAGGDGSVLPTDHRVSMTDPINVYDEHGQVTGQRQMTADEYVEVQRQAGQTKLQMVKDLMSSPVYDAMSDDARAEAIKNIYSYANYQAKRMVEPTMPDNYSDVASLSNPAAYFAASKAWSDAAGNKYNRDYDELDDMMESYQTLAPDVRAMLEAKDSQIRKVNEAYQAGISSQSYFAITDAAKDITPPEGHEKPLLYQQVSLIGNSDLSNEEKDVFMSQYLNHGENGKMSTYEAYMACRGMGFQPKHLAAFYELYNTITGDGKKQNVIAKAMEYGFTRENAIGLYGMFSNSHKWATR